ncbi:hypothetical protein [Stutzerimonas stutzeri]|uniref:hypothetical protein n=1 Tax=Stutzerimonas stutzeri TaxID=316 RepID=UPI0021095F7F|nr:hypothetical protein [Stutzerimonas stutzeri]MCQ4257324.1 hypothetical protein [Stutzerimonas stutzeri]
MLITCVLSGGQCSTLLWLPFFDRVHVCGHWLTGDRTIQVHHFPPLFSCVRSTAVRGASDREFQKIGIVSAWFILTHAPTGCGA